MTIFGCSVEKLANYLVENPGFYKTSRDFLENSLQEEILTLALRDDVSKDLTLIKKAHNLSLESEWFAFHVYDSWAEDNGNSEGVELYQKAGDKLVRKIGLDSDGVPTEDQTIEYLQQKKVKRIFSVTPNAEKGYFGVPYKDVHSSDVVQRSALQEHQLPIFKQSKIEVILLESE